MISRIFNVHWDNEVRGYKGFDCSVPPGPVVALVQDEDSVTVFSLDDKEHAVEELKRYLRDEGHDWQILLGVYEMVLGSHR